MMVPPFQLSRWLSAWLTLGIEAAGKGAEGPPGQFFTVRSQLLHQMDAIELSMLQTVAAFSGFQARSGP
jgi:hypothetical protein